MKQTARDLRHRVARLFYLSALAAGVAASASPALAQTPEKLELRYQGWASKVLYPELAEDLGYLAPIKLKWVDNTISGPQDIQAADRSSNWWRPMRRSRR
jgi:hypothetical protein